MSHRLYQTTRALIIESTEAPGALREAGPALSLDALFTADDPAALVAEAYATGAEAPPLDPTAALLAPVGGQEVWAAGVTYYRSRTARMEEAESAGGDIFYDKVYEAPRPELFFKANAARVRGHLGRVGIRSDSTWDVPEPEFTLAVNAAGRIFGHTVGNDMSSRSIEGENPLYLPQAKNYLGACALGPCLVVGPTPPPESRIALSISRDGAEVFSGETALSQIKRSFEELAGWLFKCNEFPLGAYLMTGTGIVPESDFTLREGDEVSITIGGIGTLRNVVERV
jgi:2-dehydro-3-deoxy-D-arabinonate dehydratase